MIVMAIFWTDKKNLEINQFVLNTRYGATHVGITGTMRNCPKTAREAVLVVSSKQ